MSQQGRLFLIPVPISAHEPLKSIPVANLDLLRGLKKFICENAKEARRHLKVFSYPRLEDAQMLELNVHTRQSDLPELMAFIKGEEDVGLLSDAGCPGIADPGAEVILLAHRHNIEVIPLTGPSSIVLSIMASGFNGQNFAFNGYLPLEKAERQKKLRDLEQNASKTGQAQFFMETPYRNTELFHLALNSLKPDTFFFVGRDINGPQQFIKSLRIGDWKRTPAPVLTKVPTVFGLFRF